MLVKHNNCNRVQACTGTTWESQTEQHKWQAYVARGRFWVGPIIQHQPEQHRKGLYRSVATPWSVATRWSVATPCFVAKHSFSTAVSPFRL